MASVVIRSMEYIVVDSLLAVALIVCGGCGGSYLCNVVLNNSVLSSIAFILLRKREPVALH